MALGNPTAATTNVVNRTNFLISRAQYALSYNDDTHLANWVSWSYTTGDSGSSGRTDAWSQETDLPSGYTRVGTSTFGSSYGESWDRGHLCPSGDRTFSVPDNELTFRMSNIIPQAAANNQGLWANFESYSRGLASDGDEILIVCGPSQFTGNRLSNQMAVPGSVWKIIVEVPSAPSSLPAFQRITTNSRVIAILTPNTGSGLGSWQSYITSVEQIEQITGFSFFGNVNPAVATYLKNVVDTGSGPNQPTVITSFSPFSGKAGTSVTLTGYNFGAAPIVKFNGMTAAVTVTGGGQLTAVVPAGTGSGPITVTGTGGTDSSASPFVVEPSLRFFITTLSGFGAQQGYPGPSQSYVLSGADLTGPITITASPGYEISRDNLTFTSGLSLTPSGATLADTTLYVRIAASAMVGPISGLISHTSGSQVFQSLTVTGTVSAAQTPLESWGSAYGLSGVNAAAEADPDGDGWSNAQEYAFGLNPTNSGGSLALLSQEMNQLKLTFLQKDVGGITYAVKSASSLSGGFSNSITPQLSTNTNNVPTGYRRYEATLPTSSGRGFLKVEAIIP